MAEVSSVSSSLREWQKEALSLWIDNNNKGIVEVVTGGGKTRFALACIEKWIEPGDKVLIFVPTLALQDQWVVALEDDLKIPHKNISIWGENDDPDCTFHVMVINTARTKANQLISGNWKTFLIADECHRYASPSNSGALELPYEATLGLTATAEREYDEGLSEVLVPNLGPIIFKYSIKEASLDGVVSKFSLNNVEVPLDEDEIEQISRLSRAIGKAMSEGEIEKAKLLAMRRAGVSKKAASRIPVTVRIVESNPGSRILIFHEDIQSAELIKNILQKRGTAALSYHSKIGAEMRRDNLRMFKSGMVKVLVSCRALDEGVDVPDVNVAIIAAATSSQRQRIQRLGRALRKAVGKPTAVIYTLFATSSEASSLRVESERVSEIAEIKWTSVNSLVSDENN